MTEAQRTIFGTVESAPEPKRKRKQAAVVEHTRPTAFTAPSLPQPTPQPVARSNRAPSRAQLAARNSGLPRPANWPCPRCNQERIETWETNCWVVVCVNGKCERCPDRAEVG